MCPRAQQLGITVSQCWQRVYVYFNFPTSTICLTQADRPQDTDCRGSMFAAHFGEYRQGAARGQTGRNGL